MNHNTRTIFPFFDYYCEKDGQKWFIDVTAYIKKEMPHTPLWERLGIKLGVLFIRRDLKQYCFKEDTGKTAVELRLKDIGLAPLDLSEARARSWLTRRENGNVVWNKGLTKETDERIAKYAEKCGWCKGLTKETDPRVAKRVWNTGLTKETDSRIAQQSETLRRHNAEFTNVS